MALVLALVSACTANDRDTGGTGSPGTSVAPETAHASAAASAQPLPSVDTERQAALVVEGLDEGEAEFLALTTLESEVVADHTYRVVATFPTGDEGELTITVTPDEVGDPAALELTHEVEGDDFRFRLAYLVPWEAIPSDLQDEIREGGTAGLPADALLALAAPDATNPPARVAADSNGVGVVVTGLLKQIYNRSASETARIMDERFGGRLDVSTTLAMLRALENVGNALTTSADYLDVVHEIDAIEECARNPTNPITQRAYRDDPGYRERILDQISAVRDEVKANASVLYLSHLIKTGSSLIRNVPALAFIVGPGTAWSRDALNGVTRKLIADLRKNVPSCDAIGLEFHRENIPLGTPDIGTNAQIDVTGHLDICPTNDGAGFTISGTYHDVTHSGAQEVPPQDFNLLELSGHPSPAEFTVVLSEFETAEQHIQFRETYGDAIGPDSTIAITDAGGHPTGVFTLYNGFGDHVGDFPLTVTAVEPHCPATGG